MNSILESNVNCQSSTLKRIQNGPSAVCQLSASGSDWQIWSKIYRDDVGYANRYTVHPSCITFTYRTFPNSCSWWNQKRKLAQDQEDKTKYIV